MAEQRYQAVLAVIADGETVTDVAARFGVARKTERFPGSAVCWSTNLPTRGSSASRWTVRPIVCNTASTS